MHRLVLLMLATGLLTMPCAADYCAPETDASGGMRDIMLAYIGPGRWDVDSFLPYVAYLGTPGSEEPDDWFFDSFLFCMFSGAPSGGAYYNGTANRSDWDYYLDLLFDPEHNLSAMDAAVEQVGKQLGDTQRTCPIILMIPYLAPTLEEFGDVDGVDEDPSEDADRAKAFRWVVDAMLERWSQQEYAHLRLWGFYWMHEGVSKRDADVVRATAEYVHEKGYGLHWIPWFSAPGFTECRDLGLDFTIMQPNFAFMRTPPGLLVPDHGRLTRNALLAREHGLGVEMEMNMRVALDLGQAMNLQLYLNHSVDELDGTMNGAVRAWYQAYDLVAQLCRSENPVSRRLYDDLYRFHKGTYERRALSLCEGASAMLNGRPAPELTDGLWLAQPGHEARVLSAPSPVRIDVDLGTQQIVGDVRVHIAAGPDATTVSPAVRLSTSVDGKAYSAPAESSAPVLGPVGDWSAGFVLTALPPKPARHLRVELVGPPGGTLGVDEVLVYPVQQLLWGTPCHINGVTTPVEASLVQLRLTDGRLMLTDDTDGVVTTAGGRAALNFELDETLYLGSALAHARWPAGCKPPSYRALTTHDGETRTREWVTAPAGGEAWIEVSLGTTPADSVQFELASDPGVQWDELQVVRSRNLAFGKPYDLAPAFESTYPDTGAIELTDDSISEKGFSDGETVGWVSETQVAAIVDLGEMRTLDAAQAHVQGGGYAWVNYPETIETWGSADGVEWRLLSAAAPAKTVTFTETVGGELQELAWLRQEFEPTAVRFLKWRFAGKGWLMLSELQALSGGKNVAASCNYHLLPQPTSSEQYADRGSKLTDGDYPHGRQSFAQAVGWHTGTPTVTVDLLSPTPLSVVRAHFQGGGGAAVWYPRSVAISTSLDGESWSDESVFVDPPPEGGSESLSAFIGGPIAPREARYVRLRMEREGWLMIDEIECYHP